MELISNNKSLRRLAAFYISWACGHDVIAVIDCFIAPNREHTVPLAELR